MSKTVCVGKSIYCGGKDSHVFDRDGASSTVYLGIMKDKHVAIKKLKGYSNNQGVLFVKSYESIYT